MAAGGTASLAVVVAAGCVGTGAVERVVAATGGLRDGRRWVIRLAGPVAMDSTGRGRRRGPGRGDMVDH